MTTTMPNGAASPLIGASGHPTLIAAHNIRDSKGFLNRMLEACVDCVKIQAGFREFGRRC